MITIPAGLFRQRLIAFLIPLALSAPFINRAFFVDDSYFVEIATWLKDNPGKPYDFTADDENIGNHGWEKDGFVRMVNPLAHQYFLAALMKVGGDRIWFLRLGAVLLTCFSAIFVFELARRWTEHPMLATLLTAASPPYWLTAHSLLIDSTMGFFFVGAIYFFIRSTETGSWVSGLSAGVFMGLAVLSKYPAAFIFPLTALWLSFRWKLARKAPLVAAWVVGLAILFAYSWWTARLYGRPHILAASERMVGSFGWPKVAMLMVFFAGGCLTPLVGWLSPPKWLAALGTLVFVLFTALFTSATGGFPFPSALLLGLWLSTALVFLVRLGLDHGEWVWPRDAFVAFWIYGFMAMMLVVMGWVAVRYYHIVAPAVAIAAVRTFERYWSRVDGKTAARPIAIFTSVILVFTGLLAYADAKQAEPARRIGPMLKAQGFRGGPRFFYLGDSFTMSYLRNYGWTPAFTHTRYLPGDIVLSKEVTMPLVWFMQRNPGRQEIDTFDFPTRFPIKVMDYEGSAGFYASVWGALPFTWSTGPWERFRLYEITTSNNPPPGGV